MAFRRHANEGNLRAQQATPDPFAWLEEVESKRSMDWVLAKNAATVAVLGKTPLYQPMYDRTLKILDAKDPIAYPSMVGDMLYNFWQDANHARDIWRRTLDELPRQVAPVGTRARHRCAVEGGEGHLVVRRRELPGARGAVLPGIALTGRVRRH